MRRWVVAIGIALALTQSTARADVDMTALVNAAFLSRNTDVTLHDIAHQRAVEISSDFSHNGWRGGMGEVLAWNTGHSDPAGHALNQWLGSPPHNALLSDPAYTDIGCGSYVTEGRYYAVCVLTAGGDGNTPLQEPATNPTPTSTPLAPVLPDAALP